MILLRQADPEAAPELPPGCDESSLAPGLGHPPGPDFYKGIDAALGWTEPARPTAASLRVSAETIRRFSKSRPPAQKPKTKIRKSMDIHKTLTCESATELEKVLIWATAFAVQIIKFEPLGEGRFAITLAANSSLELKNIIRWCDETARR